MLGQSGGLHYLSVAYNALLAPGDLCYLYRQSLFRGFSFAFKVGTVMLWMSPTFVLSSSRKDLEYSGIQHALGPVTNATPFYGSRKVSPSLIRLAAAGIDEIT